MRRVTAVVLGCSTALLALLASPAAAVSAHPHRDGPHPMTMARSVLVTIEMLNSLNSLNSLSESQVGELHGRQPAARRAAYCAGITFPGGLVVVTTGGIAEGLSPCEQWRRA
ncbi:hypothetical protein ACIQU4_25800 [Streptomyces sp. NPDC090741]|uniref:hypothetical protein n=1 Tax=Streptomyces sp. NPDC090741 TaxID=3365967 RepID=UPI00380D61B9